ncbi:DNA-binding protein [Pseudomonas sp. HMWF032]|uniref:DNA-binding protein n=1 Tax=Pseudomonas sp. HMWF032 TaxID=2056866 RepID=UPI000D359BD0|nr:DNA-binding protein [Pseudomonas sp. HMWF032]PTS85507.1 DNA-binding protein [Pseudomonas sp. HMWF032]PTT82262.1 DNA-binding protein [Pseudomonas sp. HMWF010]
MATATKALTATQVKERFRQRGKTITAWAVENGYTRNEVYRVLNGQAKANYGKAHDIAVALGLKVPDAEQLSAA